MPTEADTPASLRTCGNCKHSETAPRSFGENKIICFGNPPVPALVGQRQNMLGQTQLAVENLRPVLAATEHPCSLFQMRIVMDLAALKSEGRG